ncbi:hypothetical protein WDU94_000968 [Cyamophila willieti]
MSCGATASTFNSHQYCQMASSSKTSSHCFSESPRAGVEPNYAASYVTLKGVPTNSVGTDNESLCIANRVQSIKAKLKRFKKRKTRRCLIEKQLHRSLNTKLNKLKQDTDLSKFELNRFVLNKAVKGKHLKPYLNLSSRNKPKYENDDIQNDNSKENNNSCTEIPDKGLEKKSTSNEPVDVVQQSRQYTHSQPPPPPPPPPLSEKEEIENDNASNLINEVSNLVSKIAKYNKNVNIEKIKQQINILLESNSSELDQSREEDKFEVQDNVRLENCNVLQQYDNQGIAKQVEPKNVKTNQDLICMQTCLIEEIKKNIQGVKTQTNMETINDSNSPIDRSSVFKDLKHREAMIPAKDETLEGSNSTRVAEVEPCQMILTKNQEEKYSPNLSDLEESIGPSDKKCSTNEGATKQSYPPTKRNFISNDDLFFTNRRRPSVFSRPVLSILGLESDLLSDIRDSDEEYSIHEIYFKKPYYRHDSKSCTNQLDNEIVVCDYEQDSKPKQCLAKNTREKFLTKKQLEVFNKLRTIYNQEEIEQTSNANIKTALIDTRDDNIVTRDYTSFDSTTRRLCRRSKSQSFIYGHENDLSNISLKTCRSRCFGPKYDVEHQAWRILKNREIEEKYQHPDIVKVMKRRRLNWAGHVVRMNEDWIPKIVFTEKIEGYRLRGRPRTRWIDNIKKDVEKMGMNANDWTIHAANRPVWARSIEQAYGR